MFKEFRGLFLLKEVPTSEGFEKINPIKGKIFMMDLSLDYLCFMLSGKTWQN